MTQPPGPPEPDNDQPPAPKPPETRQNPDRESIWSIPTSLKKLYFGLFTAQIIIATIWLAQTAINDQNLPTAQAKILYLWQNLAPTAISSATLSLILTDAWKTTMVLGTWLEDELKKRRQRQINAAEAKGRAEAEARAEEREKARAEERDKARAEAEARAEERDKARAEAEARAETLAEERDKALAESQKWQTWNRNREAAQAAGQEFNEPPPSSPTPDPENPRQQP